MRHRQGNKAKRRFSKAYYQALRIAQRTGAPTFRVLREVERDGPEAVRLHYARIPEGKWRVRPIRVDETTQISVRLRKPGVARMLEWQVGREWAVGDTVVLNLLQLAAFFGSGLENGSDPPFDTEVTVHTPEGPQSFNLNHHAEFGLRSSGWRGWHARWEEVRKAGLETPALGSGRQWGWGQEQAWVLLSFTAEAAKVHLTRGAQSPILFPVVLQPAQPQL